MIFSGSHNGTPHVDMVLDGTKTQTRRVNRGKYQLGKSYAIQECRTCKGIEGYRIVMDKIWFEECYNTRFGVLKIFQLDALAEGRYTLEEFEKVFRELNPKWDSRSNRWVFEFHVIEVPK